MIPRLLFGCSILPLAALAQIQVLTFDGINETPVGTLVDVGAASAGDTVVTRFHVRNIGAGPAIFQTLSIAGAGFRITNPPSLPYTIAPGSFAEFDVAFNPTVIGTYSAFLAVNTINITIRGSVTPSAVLTLGSGTTPLAAGAIIDFGSVQRGSSRLQILTLSNPNNASLTVNTLAVSGAGFRGPIGTATPLQIASGQSVSFQIAFEPQNGQSAQGALTVDRRSFVLTGQGLDPPLPTASIHFGSAAGASAQQNNISIPLAAPSQISGTGTLTMQFHSSVAGATDDPAVQFLSGPKRAATVTISAGDTLAKFGTQTSIAFQTGSTAGTISFTLTLPNATQQTSLTIAPAAVSLDTAGAVRRVGNLDVSLIGVDNTYSASQLAFTFYDRNGTTIQPGVIRVDVTSDFRLYFADSQVGGQFALLATFPVSGDVNTVAGFDVQITNSAGATKTQKITF
ncbi:MAG TPA: choice-of-anchor D domain-containing protein [Bryobacteraceae bacterium]|nr:choice-of-anchor D domain-containing protein [Bryobacteraceae bacterium]